MMSVLSCDQVTKSFPRNAQRVVALDGVSFTLEPGKIIGLLGPDAAGKTTLLRILAGLLRPDSGRAEVLGWDTVRHSRMIQAHIGYMPQKFGLYANMSVEENLELYAVLRAVPKYERAAKFTELLEMTNLLPFRKRMAGKLSGGMKQKLALACALVSTPKLMLLDEPSVGVDVLSRRELWGILRKITDAGNTTVLVSTAYMDEANFCDRTLVLFEGKLVADDTPQGIRQRAISFVKKPTFEQGFQVLLTGGILPPLERKNPVANDAPVRVRADGLVKKFGSFVAVHPLSLEVRRGEIFGLLGANGAGKTTTFRMLCGLSSCDGGTVEIAGYDFRHAPGAARGKLGFVAQKFSLYRDIAVRTNLEFFGHAYGLGGKKLQERLAWAVETFGLGPYWNLTTEQLPLGFQQRLSMACALLHEPEILFLDEATSGADPIARRDFWKRIMELADSGVAIIITTHFLDEAIYCDRMLILQDGHSVAYGSCDDILRQGTCADAVPESLEDAFVHIIRSRKS